MPPSAATFEHEALLYEGLDGFLDGAVPFVREGVDAGEPVMVAVGAEKIARLAHALGDAAAGVRFVDMARLGRNPGRIIPAWREFLAERSDGRGVRGIGEPIWAGRGAAELVECQLHESLLNLAFAEAKAFRLLCPYDIAALDSGVVHEARCSHPIVAEGDERHASHEYRGPDLLAPFEAPLPKPAAHAEIVDFTIDTLDDVRRRVAQAGERAGLSPERRDDLVLAVHEATSNAVRHGGGRGLLRMWCESRAFVCEIKDRGHIDDPLIGRRRPGIDQSGGWGVWIANQLCDLVQLRSGHTGTVIRLHMAAESPVEYSWPQARHG